MGCICSNTQRITEMEHCVLRMKQQVSRLTVQVNTQNETISTFVTLQKSHISTIKKLANILHHTEEDDIEDTTGSCAYKHTKGCTMIDTIRALQKGLDTEISTLNMIDKSLDKKPIHTAVAVMELKKHSNNNLKKVHTMERIMYTN